MRGVYAHITTARYLTTAAAQKLPRGKGNAAGWSRGGLLRLRDDMDPPRLPRASGWMRLRPELSGVCGSDVGLAHAKLSLVLSAYYTSERQIPGHEIVAVVSEVGPGVENVAEGDRVVIDPVLGCAGRGVEPLCRSCAEGLPYVCERFDLPGNAGCVAPGQGFDATLGGGWAQELVAHTSQIYPVNSIPSHRAVLSEPASVALHAALQWRRSGDRAVVVGAGTIGLLTIAALRMLHEDLDIIALTIGEFGAAQARAAGASRVLPSSREAVSLLAQSDGGRVLHPRLTRIPILERGVDAVFDCVATAETIELGLHLLRPTGTLVLVGGAGKQQIDWSLVWNRQLRIQGTVNGGPEPRLNGRTSMSQVVEWLAEPNYRVDHLVTHTFALDDWRSALQTASDGPGQGAVKVTLRPNPDIALVS